MEYFLVRYDSRVVIYEHKMFIRLATGIAPMICKYIGNGRLDRFALRLRLLLSYITRSW